MSEAKVLRVPDMWPAGRYRAARRRVRAHYRLVDRLHERRNVGGRTDEQSIIGDIAQSACIRWPPSFRMPRGRSGQRPPPSFSS